MRPAPNGAVARAPEPVCARTPVGLPDDPPVFPEALPPFERPPCEPPPFEPPPDELPPPALDDGVAEGDELEPTLVGVALPEGGHGVGGGGVG